jgi:hypothetical protein
MFAVGFLLVIVLVDEYNVGRSGEKWMKVERRAFPAFRFYRRGRTYVPWAL